MRLADNKPILHKLSNVLPRVRHRYFANLWAVVRNGVRNPKSKAEALRLEGEGVWQAIRSSHAKDIDARHHHAHRKKYILAVSYAAARRQHHTVRSVSKGGPALGSNEWIAYLVGIHPYLSGSAFKDGSGKALLKLERHHLSAQGRLGGFVPGCDLQF